jgi:hypothetical protein
MKEENDQLTSNDPSHEDEKPSPVPWKWLIPICIIQFCESFGFTSAFSYLGCVICVCFVVFLVVMCCIIIAIELQFVFVSLFVCFFLHFIVANRFMVFSFGVTDDKDKVGYIQLNNYIHNHFILLIAIHNT